MCTWSSTLKLDLERLHGLVGWNIAGAYVTVVSLLVVLTIFYIREVEGV